MVRAAVVLARGGAPGVVWGVALGVVLGGWVAAGCSVAPNQGIWTKHLDSGTPLFRVVVGGKAGYIDREGRVVIPPQFAPNTYFNESHGDFVQGVAEVTGDTNGGTTGLLLYPDGKRTAKDGPLDRYYEGLSTFMEKPAMDRTKPPRLVGMLGYENERGEKVIPARFAFGGEYAEGLAPVALDGACWVRSPIGGRWPAPSAEQVFTSCGPQPAESVTEPCRHGFIDKSGQFVIPAEYELARSFREGRAAVRKSQRWGFVDRDGKVAVRFVYDEVRDFRESLAAVRREGRWEYVDRAGETVIAGPYEDALAFGSGLAPVKVRGAWSYLNTRGGTAIAGPFLQATVFVQGLAHVQLAKARWAWIDPQGRRVFEYEWDAAR